MIGKTPQHGNDDRAGARRVPTRRGDFSVTSDPRGSAIVELYELVFVSGIVAELEESAGIKAIFFEESWGKPGWIACAVNDNRVSAG